MDEENVQSLKDLANSSAALALYDFHEVTQSLGNSLPKVRAKEEVKKFINQKVKSLHLPTRVKESLLADLTRMCPEIWETHFQFYRVHGQVSEMRGHECHCSKEIDYRSHISLPDGRVDYRKSFEEVIKDKRTDLVCRFVLALHLYIPVDVIFYFFNQLPQAMQDNFIEKDVPLILQYYDKKATTCGQFITKNGLFSLNFCQFIQKLLYEKGYMKTENVWPTATFYRYLLVHKYKKSVIIY